MLTRAPATAGYRHCYEEDEAVAVCVVDGDGSTFDLLATDFEDVRNYADAESFLAGIDESSSASVIVANVQLPGINGIELIKRLRERGFAVPVIAIGEDDVATAVHAIRQGATEYFARTHLAAHLSVTVHRLLRAGG
jgi:two-component system, LuxR family, response regulator FixJ